MNVIHLLFVLQPRREETHYSLCVFFAVFLTWKPNTQREIFIFKHMCLINNYFVVVVVVEYLCSFLSNSIICTKIVMCYCVFVQLLLLIPAIEFLTLSAGSIKMIWILEKYLIGTRRPNWMRISKCKWNDGAPLIRATVNCICSERSILMAAEVRVETISSRLNCLSPSLLYRSPSDAPNGLRHAFNCEQHSFIA